MLRQEWTRLGINGFLTIHAAHKGEEIGLCLSVEASLAQEWMPDFDTLDLASRLKLDGARDDDLLREIWLTLLRSPVSVEFPSAEELMIAVQLRLRIVRNSQLTCLNFHTSEVERPSDCWRYDEETGFVLVPGSSLISSLRKACHPGLTGQLYSFSCARATEYVVLLSIAELSRDHNPKLLADLQAQWEIKAIQAGRFRQAFLQELGSMDYPLPIHYYVPGDRVWFRNPDAASFDAKGFEGSWVFYLGGGMFANFWKRDAPFSLPHKCVEIYHWRDGLRFDSQGEAQIDETEVERRVAETLNDPVALERVYERMHRLRDRSGVHADGGCMDATRESPRFLLAPHCDMIEQMNDWP